MNKFYLTNAIPYVNAAPHVGHAYEFILSDVVKRYHEQIGNDTLLLCGGDENALKNVQAAEKAKEPVQEFVNRNTKLFEDLAKKLNISFDIFQKGSSSSHHKSSQKLWSLCEKKGDIYKKTYSGLYCVGCELFYDPSELNEKGECQEHPGKKLDEVTEENYFFKLSKYQKEIEDLIETGKLKIVPEVRKKEVLSFLNQGLKDISISRSNKRAKNWGVSVPGDESQKMYVWFDALNIYQSGIGFGLDEEKYNKWWPADLHVLGKGIIRFHAIYWPAFLISAGLKLPKSLLVHGYLTVGGQKMSKTLGNVIDPNELIKKYGVDPVRYYFLREVPATGDGDFSEERFKEVYNADLANSLGNLASRVSKLCEKNDFSFKTENPNTFFQDVEENIKSYSFNLALLNLWRSIDLINKTLNEEEPWKITDSNLLKEKLQNYVQKILQISFNLKPFLPETAKKIEEQFVKEKISSSAPLFPRK